MSAQILLTNDDGIQAPGIAVLRAALEGLGVVTTVAPDRNTSAVARGITIDRPLTLRPRTFGDDWMGLSCDGTPSDCVRVGLIGVETPAPDLVVSGVNLGGNMGADVTYSGTVGAAFEAALRGRPAIAFSVESRSPGWLVEAVPVLRLIVEHVLACGLPSQSILNVNLPDRPLARIEGIRPARLGGASRHDRVTLMAFGDGEHASPGDGDGRRDVDAAAASRTYDVPCDVPATASRADVDFDVVARGWVAVTPLRYDLFDPDLLGELLSWDLDLERVRG